MLYLPDAGLLAPVTIVAVSLSFFSGFSMSF